MCTDYYRSQERQRILLSKINKLYKYKKIEKLLTREIKMIDELKSEEIINKVGGRFKLTALVQRRLGELVQGARPLIEDIEGKTTLEIVVQEILQDKISVDDGTTTEDAENTEKK